MKKVVFILLLAVVLAGGVFGFDIDFNAGGGLLLGYTFTRYSLEAAESQGGGNIKSIQSMDRFNYGGFLFFDAVYGELVIMLQGGNSSYQETMDYTPKSAPVENVTTDRGTGFEMSVGFSLLAKYPFTINEDMSWFPLLGIEYQIALLEWRKPDGDSTHDRTTGSLASDRDKDGDPFPLSAWNSFWIDIGAGLDYTLAGPWYVRSEFLFGFRLPTGYENSALEMVKAQFKTSDPKLKGLTGTPCLKIGIGYRL